MSSTPRLLKSFLALMALWVSRSRPTTRFARIMFTNYGSEAQKQKYLVPLARGEHARRLGVDRTGRRF